VVSTGVATPESFGLDNPETTPPSIPTNPATPPADVEPTYSPVTKNHIGTGMSIVDICAAAVVLSDNTAGNLLLRLLGGPEGLTRSCRSLDDKVARLDRTKPTLNTAIPGDERDTTSPRVMVADMRRILLGDTLSGASRQRLETWLIDAKVGGNRLRAGIPSAWRIGDKTGSGENGTANTIGIPSARRYSPPCTTPVRRNRAISSTLSTPRSEDWSPIRSGRDAKRQQLQHVRHALVLGSMLR
jgi:hypothetical protein